MTTSTLITSSPITPEQEDHIAGLASVGAKKILRNLKLDSAAAQRVAMRFDEVLQVMSAKMSEVSLDPAATTSSSICPALRSDLRVITALTSPARAQCWAC